MADETKPAEEHAASKGILGMGSKIPLDAIIIVVVPFLVFVFLFLHVMGFLPPQPLRVKVIMPESQASEAQSTNSLGETQQIDQSTASSNEKMVDLASQGVLTEATQQSVADQANNASQDVEKPLPSTVEVKGDTTKPVGGEINNEARLKQLAKVYEQMKPASVAAIMSTMSDYEATEILKRMKPRDAAKILALIEPQRAARLSRMMTE